MADSVADQRVDNAFIASGVNNWKHALEKFRSHQKSHCHTFAVKQLIQYDHAATVNAQLNQQAADDQAEARSVRRVMISAVLYLARQGMPLRGHDGEDGKFYQLLKLRI